MGAPVHQYTSTPEKKKSVYLSGALVLWCSGAPTSDKSNKGFSLLELIIAIAVLAIGLVGVLQIFPIGLRASQTAGMLTKASFLAQNKIEDIKLAGFDAIIELPPKIPMSGKDRDFEWTVKIDEASLEGIESGGDIRKVMVTITWPERNTTRSKEFITYVSKQ